MRPGFGHSKVSEQIRKAAVGYLGPLNVRGQKFKFGRAGQVSAISQYVKPRSWQIATVTGEFRSGTLYSPTIGHLVGWSYPASSH